ncbi:MAG: hypothetical protein FWG42_12145, partial [Clostridiales bacterium]|nr:hypothetical protein [Clostridiales bacterium]
AEAKANMPAMCEAALKQAEENDYKDAFLASGVKHVRLYGIAFWKKTCMVKTNSSTMAIV